MKAFHFNLEQVLRMKHWREEEAKKALAVEVAVLEDLKGRLNTLRGEMNGLLESDAGSPGPDIDFQGRLGLLQYARHLVDLISGQEGSISEQGVRIKAKADLLFKAMQERKVLEKLKERRMQEHRQERNRREYANLDEASAGLMRRNAGASAEAGAMTDSGEGAVT